MACQKRAERHITSERLRTAYSYMRRIMPVAQGIWKGLVGPCLQYSMAMSPSFKAGWHENDQTDRHPVLQSWITFREQLAHALEPTQVKPIICLQEQRLTGTRCHEAAKKTRMKGWSWFAHPVTQTGETLPVQITSGGVAILTPMRKEATVIPACDEEWEQRTVAVQIHMGQSL
eukprot:4681681-Amphidinium_carterae.2